MNEYQLFLCALKRLGIQYEHHHAPGLSPHKEFFQQKLLEIGLHITVNATVAILLGEVWYLFSTGKPHWTTLESDPADMSGHRGWGEDAMFLFSWDKVTNHFQARTFNNLLDITGLNAIERTMGTQYPRFTPPGS